MTKISVVAVPFIRSIDEHIFMVETLASLRANNTLHELEFIAIVNKADGSDCSLTWIHENFDYVEINDENNLARAWNRGIRAAFAGGADYCLVINLDVVFHPQFIENLVAYATCNPEPVIWSGQAHPDQSSLKSASLEGEPRRGVDFCAFMVDRRLSQLVGPFDESFSPAYHEDADMVYRVALRNLTTASTPAATYFHFESVTLQCAIMANARNFTKAIFDGVKRTRKLYEQKWGGPPGEEKYRDPFNQSPGISGPPA